MSIGKPTELPAPVSWRTFSSGEAGAVEPAEIGPFEAGIGAASDSRRCDFCCLEKIDSNAALMRFGLRIFSMRRKKKNPMTAATILAPQIPAHGAMEPC